MRVPGDDGIGAFPTISDFKLNVNKGILELVSAQRGRLASFPGWEHADRDLRHFTPSDVPIGTMEEPFDDADDNWRIVIFEHKGFVYVLEASDPHAVDFPRFFRIPTERYLAAWAILIDVFNPISPLDDA